MRKEKTISVVICAYNAERFIEQALDSVFAQTVLVEQVEVIVVDDGSTDSTGRILREKYKGRIKYVYRENGGHTAAVNTALEYVGGEYICFLDADDYWDSEKLHEVLELFEKDHEVDIVYNYMRVVDDAGETIMLQPKENSTNPDFLSDDHLNELLNGRIPYAPPTSGISLRASCMQAFGKLPEERPGPDLIIRSILPLFSGKVRFVRKCLHSYRIHSQNTWANKPRNLETLQRDIKDYLEVKKQVGLNAKKCGHDVGKYIARLDQEIMAREILCLRLEGRLAAAFWKALTGKYRVFDRHRYARLYWIYAKINLIICALLSHDAYDRFHSAYQKTKFYEMLHVYWRKI